MPLGKSVDFEFSMRRAVSQQLAASTTTRALTVTSLARLRIDIRNARRLAVGPHHHFPAHRAGASSRLPVASAGDVYAGRCEVGIDRAGASALRAVVAGRPAVERFGQNRQPRRDARNLELVADLLNNALVGARRGRGLEAPVWRIFQAFLRAEDADQFLDALS